MSHNHVHRFQNRKVKNRKPNAPKFAMGKWRIMLSCKSAIPLCVWVSFGSFALALSISFALCLFSFPLLFLQVKVLFLLAMWLCEWCEKIDAVKKRGNPKNRNDTEKCIMILEFFFPIFSFAGNFRTYSIALQMNVDLFKHNGIFHSTRFADGFSSLQTKQRRSRNNIHGDVRHKALHNRAWKSET